MRLWLALTSAALLVACSNGDKAKTSEAVSSGAATATAPAGVPAPKAGLWEQTMSGGPLPAAVVAKICFGAADPDSNPFAAPPPPGADCTQASNAVPGGAEFHSTCKADGMTIVSDGKVSGLTDTAYKVEITSKTTGSDVPPQMANVTMTIDAKRLGDCPAGVAPNSVVP